MIDRINYDAWKKKNIDGVNIRVSDKNELSGDRLIESLSFFYEYLGVLKFLKTHNCMI